MVQHIRLTLLTTLAFTAFGAGCASAPTTDAAGNAVAANAEGQPVRECRYAEGTGTKMRYRICRSQDEWAVLDAAAAEDQDTDEFFRRTREGGAAAGNVEAPDIGGGGGGL